MVLVNAKLQRMPLRVMRIMLWMSYSRFPGGGKWYAVSAGFCALGAILRGAFFRCQLIGALESLVGDASNHETALKQRALAIPYFRAYS